MSDTDGLVPLPEMSPTFWDFIDRCEKVNRHIDESLRGLMIPRRAALYGAYLSIVQEHFLSMLFLIKQHCHASTAALARCHMEAVCRGMWINLHATDSDVDTLYKWQPFNFPKIEVMMDAIDARYGGDGSFKGFSAHWGTLCGFTHGGVEQLSRRFSDDGGITSSFTEMELFQIVTIAVNASTAAAVPFLVTLNQPQKARDLEKFHLNIFEWSN